MFERGVSYLNSFEKRGLDVVVAGTASVITAPVVGALALVKYIEDGENPFFIQERVGKEGKIIRIIKIRSMRGGTESDEERVTDLGKWLRKTHLDELPQFWLVVAGEMSLVGARPLRKMDLNQIVNKVSEKRHLDIVSDYDISAKGVTGLWQLIGSGPENNHKIYHPNRFYLDNANMLLDLKIIFRTAQKVLKSLN